MRLVEPCGGQILVDGVNTAELELSELRGRISIIPQGLSESYAQQKSGAVLCAVF